MTVKENAKEFCIPCPEICKQRKHLLELYFLQQLTAKRNLQTPSALFGAVALGLVFTPHRPRHPAGVAI